MIRKQEGEITWTVADVVEDGQLIKELRFDKQSYGEYAGQYHPLFFALPMVFLSNFIEPEYKLWRAYAGDFCLGSNLVSDNGRLLSYEEGRRAVAEFADKEP